MNWDWRLHPKLIYSAQLLSVCSPGVFPPNLEPVTEDLHYTGLLSGPCQENLLLCPKPPDRSTLENNGQVGDGRVPAWGPSEHHHSSGGSLPTWASRTGELPQREHHSLMQPVSHRLGSHTEPTHTTQYQFASQTLFQWSKLWPASEKILPLWKQFFEPICYTRYGQGNNFERVSNLMVKFPGSQFWGSEKGFAVFHQYRGFPGGTSGKEPTCPCRRCKRHGFDSWVRTIPLEKGITTQWQKDICWTPVHLLENSAGSTYSSTSDLLPR